MDLVTLEEYKEYNGIKKPDEDAKNSLLIDSVSALIKAYLGINNPEGGNSYTETHTVEYDTDTIFLDRYPVDTITSVSELDRYTVDSTVHVPLAYSSDYSVNKELGTITRLLSPSGLARWPIGPGAVTITYTTAPKWAGGIVPADLKLAAIQLVNYYKNEEFRQSKTIQGSSIVNTLAQGEDFPKHIQVILDRYR